MPRKARIDAPGALHHVIARGIGRRKVFDDDDDRYKSILCQEDSYLLELTRYVHLNPLRAKSQRWGTGSERRRVVYREILAEGWRIPEGG